MRDVVGEAVTVLLGLIVFSIVMSLVLFVLLGNCRRLRRTK